MAKYLDDNGLLYFWQKIKTVFVAKETGKGLSTNDYTTTEKTKLAGIAEGAEVNVNADWNATSGDAKILNKPSIPSKTSDLTNDSNFVADANYVHTDNNFTTTHMNKLAGIASGAEVNVQSDWNAVSGDAYIKNKPTIPKKTSELTNDSNFVADANYVHSDNNYTTTEKNKLAGIEEGAEVNPQYVFGSSDNDIINWSRDTESGIDCLILNYMQEGDIPDHLSIPTLAAFIAAAANLVPISRTVNGKALSGDISLDASDVGALPSSTVIPSAATATPSMDGTAAVGTSSKYAKEDHVHPTDTSRAPLASPNFSGTPTAPTAAAGTNSTQIASTAFVATAIANAVTGAAMFQGTVSAQSTISNSNYKKGWYWVVDTAGTYVGQTCEAGDMIYAIADKASSYKAADFSVVQTNLDIIAITNAEIDTILAA